MYKTNLFNQENESKFFKNIDKPIILEDKYQIIELIGKGGYSEVYKAYDLENHIYVCVKLNEIKQNWKNEIRDNYFRHTVRENKINLKLDHNNIIKYYEYIVLDNYSFCIILEYCTGPDLATYIKLNKNITEKKSRIIIKQILEALNYLHNLEQKIIHYDLKPENILFNDMNIKLCDFGLSKIIDSDNNYIQLTSQGVGTYYYLPPECFMKSKDLKISTKVDIWSVGIILFEMLFRKKPFLNGKNDIEFFKNNTLLDSKYLDIPKEPEISEDCKNFIKNCLKYNEDERYDSYQALESSFIKNDK